MATTLFTTLSGVTGSLAAGASSSLNLTGLLGNNVVIAKIVAEPSVIGSGETIRVRLCKKDTHLDADRVFDTSAFEGNGYFPKFDDGSGPTELNEGLVCLYEDLDATNELHLKLTNVAGSSKTITYEVTYFPVEKVALGTYTPTLTNTTNVGASTAHLCYWKRTGNWVDVDFWVEIDPTLAAPTATVLTMSLPVASNLTSAEDLRGTGVSADVAGQCAIVYADTTNDKALIGFLASSGINTTMAGSFGYVVK